MIRYYGAYSNVSRGIRKKLEGVETVTWKAEVTEVPPPLGSKELKRRWSYFIRKVYETDLLSAPSARAKCTSSATSTRVRSSKRFFNAWVYGRNPMSRRIEVPRREIRGLT